MVLVKREYFNIEKLQELLLQNIGKYLKLYLERDYLLGNYPLKNCLLASLSLENCLSGIYLTQQQHSYQKMSFFIQIDFCFYCKLPILRRKQQILYSNQESISINIFINKYIQIISYQYKYFKNKGYAVLLTCYLRLLLRSFKAKYKSIDKVYSYFCYSEEFSEKQPFLSTFNDLITMMLDIW